MSEVSNSVGKVVRIAGPVVAATGLREARLFDVVHVGNMGLIGEVIRQSGDVATVQVYEDTGGLQVGEPVRNTGAALVVELGPGLLGSVYDGLQRPLTSPTTQTSAFLERGAAAEPLAKDKRWLFTPQVEMGQMVRSGDMLGTVPESQTIEHRVMVPPGVNGRVHQIYSGAFTVDDVIAVLISDKGEQHHLTLRQQWPVRRPRPFSRKLTPNQPLITGTRIIDTFFPVAKGGNAIIPGGFGTGKTVVEQTLARWADTDVVVYIGCGERGNEMAEVLEDFPKLEDPKHGTPLMERTILIANTSNMPVAAREASIYTGITIAEYYRDMGYDVLLLADSTSRWGEALREISGRLEEMPGEEAYPAYLAARLAEFYERAGRICCLGSEEQDNENGSSAARMGSVTIVGAVSPPGGDFSEPMTQNSLRVVGTFWALDYDLSRRRHFPAINWTRSYTLYKLQAWYADAVTADWQNIIAQAMALLQEEVELLEIVQLVGPDSLADEQKLVLAVTRMLREDFLQQSAYHEIDRYCPLSKAYWMLTIVLTFRRLATAVLANGISLNSITNLPVLTEIARMKELPVTDAPERLQTILNKLEQQFEELT
ncbi:MAG: V-type ATP synthase subunit A [Ardenticatenaceae bacterium]|nr:V-type ATP synthase subunit A [Ardenticatenaceae bacterium]MCB9445093.1 V-type ATP synthase subunit A [Ardenticatenaceae bacterium]